MEGDARASGGRATIGIVREREMTRRAVDRHGGRRRMITATEIRKGAKTRRGAGGTRIGRPHACACPRVYPVYTEKPTALEPTKYRMDSDPDGYFSEA